MAIDMSARYRVDGYPGVAFFLLGYAQEFVRDTYTDLDDDGEEIEYESEEGEYLDRTDKVRAVMVGDDREHIVDVADLAVLGEGEFCAECGQIGCEHDGRSSE